ncbi:hypothetical protein SAMN05421803_101713 [Nocardiopsis flavescens]|uniref:Uncharacterized protein n=1 Tax=Nocardiopsis flavescens TaxID=758803 RepID=A0A1M6CI23_9ACTN|nr:hypothetical protein [Nocardiopsis flavescens]SHI60636.1 hypothetical protein SAMN05421803_101713 [Nocardiopsis flavescens]
MREEDGQMSHRHEYDMAHRAAENLSLQAQGYAADQPDVACALAAAAQVHATLALAAATMVAAEQNPKPPTTRARTDS